ncbi:unnamed protein product [Closterium sp. Naga37s-1]|nr:unnamed protein product [Closterium sp. Naga37s-1]
MLVTQRNRAGRKWLRDVKLLHKVLDPYEEVYHPQVAGLPVAEDDDPGFEQIPAVIWLPGIQEPMLLNLSCHSCMICSSNHRSADHSSFAIMRKSRINNPFQITVAQLQAVNGKNLGHGPEPTAFKADPGMFFISIDIEVEVWTCAVCDYTCGWALDSAFRHMSDPSHVAKINQLVSSRTPLEELRGSKPSLCGLDISYDSPPSVPSFYFVQTPPVSLAGCFSVFCPVDGCVPTH